MLEDKTANNVIKRYHRIVTGDQNQIELGIIPEGKISITANGNDIDVTQYAKADVSVSGGTIYTKTISLINATNKAVTVKNAPFVDDSGNRIDIVFDGTANETKQVKCLKTVPSYSYCSFAMTLDFGTAENAPANVYTKQDSGAVQYDAGFLKSGSRFIMVNSGDVSSTFKFGVSNS